MPENGSLITINGEVFATMITPKPRRRAARGTMYTPADSVLFEAPKPGWAAPLLGEFNGECLRGTMACLAGIHPREIRPIPPNAPGQSGPAFWNAYQLEMKRHGFVIRYVDGSVSIQRWQDWKLSDIPAPHTTPGNLWGAVVPSPRGPHSSHALVMNGGKVHYDTAHNLRPSGQRPRKFYTAFTLEPLN